MDEVIKTVRHIHRMSHEEWVRQNLMRQGRLAEMPAETAAGLALAARVDHGRWLVDCPACPGADLIDLDDLRFFCWDCGNRDTPGKWLTVIIPAAEDRRAIEAALLMRRDVRERNWRPGENIPGKAD